MQKIILTSYQSPGDIVMLTAAVRDLHRCHPGRFITDVRTSCPQLWENNVFITPLDESDPDVLTIPCEYPLIHLSKGVTRVLTPAGLGLGMDRGERFEEILEEAEVRLDSGDVFLFFTDGLSEAMNGRAELFGERRLRDVLEHVIATESDEVELKDRILDEIRSFVGDAAQHDDMTMVILKVV